MLDIVPGTSVDGPGLRTSVYLAGCTHHCIGCHNPESWDIATGYQLTFDEVIDIIEENEENLTLTGGDPLFQAETLTRFMDRLKQRLPDINVWLYTGYGFEQIIANLQFANILSKVDVIVDGPFIENRRDTSLRFRGSSNQRLIDVAASSGDTIVEWTDIECQ